jgi:hypothetical protein
VHTYDIFKEGVSKEKVGTKEFAQAVAARMGQKPETLKPGAVHGFERTAGQAISALLHSGQRRKLLVWTCSCISAARRRNWAEVETLKRRRSEAANAFQSRHQGLPNGAPETFLHRSLALPLRERKRWRTDFARADHRSVAARVRRRPRLHQN